MLGLTTLGIIHTAISLVAVFAALVLFFRDKEITSRTGFGQVYLISTILACLTGFGIYQHGGFGQAHVVGVVTLLVLGLAEYARRQPAFGKASPYVERVSYTATFLFHMIPAVVETTTRLPVGNPLVADRNGPELQKAVGVLFVLFLIGAALQIRRLRAQSQSSPSAFAVPVLD